MYVNPRLNRLQRNLITLGQLKEKYGSLTCYFHSPVESAVDEVVRKCMVKTVERKAPKRLLLTFSRSRMGNFEESTEVLQLPDGSRSEWYSRLTEEFYIK